MRAAHRTTQLLSLLASAFLIVAIVFAIRALTAGQHAVNEIGTGASHAAQQIQSAEQQLTNAQQQAARAARPPEGAPCTPKGGGRGVIVYHGFDSGYDCVPQLP